MMKRRLFALAFALANAFGAQAQGLKVSLERGESYSFLRSQTFGKLEMTPHLAIWIEDDTGSFLKTVYVSLKNGKQDFWVGKRLHPLPVWEARHAAEKIPDAVGGASPAPKAPVLLEWRASVSKALASSGYSVWLEANIGFDYNEFFPDDGKEVWGQSSVLFRAVVPPGSAPGTEFELSPMGRSKGTKGDSQEGFDGLTSAMKILRKALVKVE